MRYRSTRRDFLRTGLSVGAGVAAIGPWRNRTSAAEEAPSYKIALDELSLRRSLAEGKTKHLDFAKTAKADFGIDAVDYNTQFFKDKAKDDKYLADMKQRAADNGVASKTLVIDNAMSLSDFVEDERRKAADEYIAWIDAAKNIGCTTVHVDPSAKGTYIGTYDEQIKLAMDGLRRIAEYAALNQMQVVLGNHTGLSRVPAWLNLLVDKINLPNCGTAPDFFNFGNYDPYLGVEQLMPRAKRVIAASRDFDGAGNETRIDYRKMLKIVRDAGYRGYVSIRYDGKTLSEPDGIKATKTLLEKVRGELG